MKAVCGGMVRSVSNRPSDNQWRSAEWHTQDSRCSIEQNAVIGQQTSDSERTTYDLSLLRGAVSKMIVQLWFQTMADIGPQELFSFS